MMLSLIANIAGNGITVGLAHTEGSVSALPCE